MAGRRRTVADLEVMLRANTAQLQKSLDDVKRKIQDTGHQVERSAKEMRGGLEETREGIMLLGEQIGVHMNREVSRFLAKMPMVATAVDAAFKTVAVIALIEMVAEAGKKVYEFAEKNDEAAKKNREAWEQVTKSIEGVNNDLTLSNSRIDDSIAKLEHKPSDGLKTALLEAADAAQKLSDKLDQDIQKMLQLTTQRKIGLIDELTGKGQSDLDRTIGYGATQAKGVIDRSQDVISRATKRGDWDNVHQERQFEIQQLHQVLDPQIATLGDYLRQHQDLATTDPNNPDFAKARSGYYGLKGIVEAIEQQDESEQKQRTEKHLTSVQGNTGILNTLDQKRLKSLQIMLEQKEEILGKDAAFELKYWNTVIGQLHKGTAAYQEAQQHQHEAFMAMEANFHKLEQVSNARVRHNESAAADFGTYRQFALAPGDAMLDSAQQRAAEIAWKNQDRYQQTAQRIGVRSGRISPHQEALNNELANNQMFQAQLIALTAQLQNIVGFDSEAKARRQQVQNQISQLSGTYRAQHLEDEYAVQMTTARGKVLESLNQMANAFTDTGAQLADIMGRTVNTVNDTIMTVLTTPGSMRRGQHLWGNTGAAIASGVGRTALEHTEGLFMKSLGFGSHKAPKGTSSDRLHVTTKAEESSSGSGAGGLLGVLNNSDWFGKHMGGLFGKGGIFDQNGDDSDSSGGGGGGGGIFSSIIGGLFGGGNGGGHALGGDVVGGMPITVGELGPETFTPPTNGTITPHSQAFRSANNIHIDARGTNDPAAVHAAVHQAMAAYLPHMGSMAVAAQKDNARRRPVSKR